MKAVLQFDRPSSWEVQELGELERHGDQRVSDQTFHIVRESATRETDREAATPGISQANDSSEC